VSIDVSIVEDDAQVREIFAGWINRTQGFRCVKDYPNGEMAIEGMKASRPGIVLMDINLPGVNGIECVGRLKPLLPETQFVMLTVYEDASHLFNALAAGASGYLLKRTTRDELIAALKQVQAGGSPMSNNIARKVVESFHRSAPELSESGQLTDREWKVLELLARGDLYKEIADTLGISVATVDSHVRHIYEKLHVRSRTMAAAKYARLLPRGGMPGS
jgi:DNA-binding NarL/FixJ family response regulator